MKSALAILFTSLGLGLLSGCFLQVNNSFTADEGLIVDPDTPVASEDLYEQAYSTISQNCIGCHAEGSGRIFLVPSSMPEQAHFVSSLLALDEISKEAPADGLFLKRLNGESGIDSGLFMPQGEALSEVDAAGYTAVESWVKALKSP